MRNPLNKPLRIPGAALLLGAGPALAQPFSINWHTIDGGGGTSTGGGFELTGTIGQPDAGTLSGGTLACAGGFWTGAGGPLPCYPNCDSSTVSPVLNVGDFTCFLQRYAAAEAYANCDNSTVAPVLNVGDFTCFLQRYAAGCP